MSLFQRKGVKAVGGVVAGLCAVAGLVALSGAVRLPWAAAAADELPATETQPSGLASSHRRTDPYPVRSGRRATGSGYSQRQR